MYVESFNYEGKSMLIMGKKDKKKLDYISIHIEYIRFFSPFTSVLEKKDILCIKIIHQNDTFDFFAFLDIEKIRKRQKFWGHSVFNYYIKFLLLFQKDRISLFQIKEQNMKILREIIVVFEQLEYEVKYDS